MSADRRRLTVGLPVYNGERFLAEAIESILAQDYADFQLVVSDTASTDGTHAICRDYERAGRLVYLRSEDNPGASWNFNRLVLDSTSELFKWAACDDLYAPEYLSTCVALLDAQPEAVLGHSETVHIDEHGATGLRRAQEQGEGSPDPAERLGAVLRSRHCFAQFGVLRRSVLAETGLLRAFPGGDRVLLADLALRGPFAVVPEALFFNRKHKGRSVAAYPDASRRAVWFDRSKADVISFPRWRLALEYARSVRAAPLSAHERRRAYGQLPAWAYRYRNQLAVDLGKGVGAHLSRRWGAARQA